MKLAFLTKGNTLLLFLLLLIPFSGIAQAADVPAKFLSLTVQQQIDSLLDLSEKFVANDPDTAVYFASIAFDVENNQFSTTSTRSAKLLADAYYYQNNFQLAIYYYQISADAEKAEHGEKSNQYASRINDAGYCYYMMGYHEMAIMNYNTALKIFRETHDEVEIYSTLNNIGTVYFKWSEYEKAIHYYEQTLEFDKQQGDDYNLSVTYNNIGKVYHSWKKYPLAIDYFTLSLEHARTSGRLNIESVKLSNLGMTYYEIGEFDTALIYVSKALELDQKLGNPFKIAIRKSEMARILAARGAFTKAIEYSLSALAFFEDANILESQAIIHKDLGDFYEKKELFDQSKDNYLRSIEIAEDIGSAYQAMIATKQLSLLYEEWNKPTEALLYYKKYEALSTSIFNKEKHKQLADFEIKYQTREKELENQLLKDENIQKENRLIYLTFALACLLLLIVLLFYGIRVKTKSIRQQKALSELELKAKEKEKQHLADKVFAEKQINRLQQQQYKANIEHKNQRLANSTLDLIQKNEFLITLKSKITNNGQDTELTKKEIVSLINQNIDIDQNWKKFRYDFNQTHPGFFDKLKVKFPDLSETYTQLCAFLRIGLSSKEIAQLQNVSDSAINKNRQRLRKKLGLEAETDLSAFLKELA